MRLELLLHALLLLVVLFLLVRALVALARRVGLLLLRYYTYSKVRRSLVRCMYLHFGALGFVVVVGFLLWMRDRDLEMAEWGIVVLPWSLVCGMKVAGILSLRRPFVCARMR